MTSSWHYCYRQRLFNVLTSFLILSNALLFKTFIRQNFASARSFKDGISDSLVERSREITMHGPEDWTGYEELLVVAFWYLFICTLYFWTSQGQHSLELRTFIIFAYFVILFTDICWQLVFAYHCPELWAPHPTTPHPARNSKIKA